MSTREIQPTLSVPNNHNLRIAIVHARFNSDITTKQVESATAVLKEYNIPYDVFSVSGCYEIPYMLDRYAQTKKYNALIALGCLIKGESLHFEVISYAVSKAITDVILAHHIPVGFGIITAFTREQAEQRTIIGHDAAYAAIESIL